MFKSTAHFQAAIVLAGMISMVSTATVKNCYPNITEPNVPILYLGGVDLHRNCEIAISSKLHQCHTQYVETVKQTFVQAKCYEGAESVKREMCCSLWTAKQCMVEASESSSECISNVTALYKALPSSREDREHLLDQCSEYGEGVASCDVTDFRSGSFFGTFIIILFVFISLPAIAFGAMKLHEVYQDYKTFKLEEAQRHQQQPHETVDYPEDGMPLNEKIQYDQEDDENNNELKA